MCQFTQISTLPILLFTLNWLASETNHGYIKTTWSRHEIWVEKHGFRMPLLWLLASRRTKIQFSGKNCSISIFSMYQCGKVQFGVQWHIPPLHWGTFSNPYLTPAPWCHNVTMIVFWPPVQLSVNMYKDGVRICWLQFTTGDKIKYFSVTYHPRTKARHDNALIQAT